MAIRIRKVEDRVVALCAAETDPALGDTYLDDAQHEALVAKFRRDYQGEIIKILDKEDVRLAQTQKLHDAKEEIERWLKEREHR